METVVKKKKIRWAGVAFLATSGFIGFVAAPVYIWKFGLSWIEWILFIFYALATMMAITAGYHRLYAHAAYRAHPVVEFLVLFFGAAAFEQSALRWASLHRSHHKFVDTDKDPYNIKRGFFFAHMGWLMTNKPVVEYDNSPDLRKNPLVMRQHNHYQLWALGSGLVIPAVIGTLTGHFFGTVIFAIGTRLAIVHHSTFFINSFAHTFGSTPYDVTSSAKDNWLGAFLTNGEGYHNYHHRFPSDYRNGIRWYHWDPTKWTIWLLSKMGLAFELKRTPPLSIQSARSETLAAKRSR